MPHAWSVIVTHSSGFAIILVCTIHIVTVSIISAFARCLVNASSVIAIRDISSYTGCFVSASYVCAVGCGYCLPRTYVIGAIIWIYIGTANIVRSLARQNS